MGKRERCVSGVCGVWSVGCGTMRPDQEEAGSRGDGSPRDLHAPPPEGGAASRKGGLTTSATGRVGEEQQIGGRDFESEPGSGHPTLGTRGESAGPSVRVVGRKRADPDKTGDKTAPFRHD